MKLLTVREVAHLLSMSDSGVYKLVARTAIPYKRIGRILRFDGDEINDWLEQSSVTPDVDVEEHVDAMIQELGLR